MGVSWLVVSWQGVKLRVRAGALRPVADTMALSIVSAGFCLFVFFWLLEKIVPLESVLSGGAMWVCLSCSH